MTEFSSEEKIILIQYGIQKYENEETIIEKLKIVTQNIAPIDALTLANEAGDPRTENSVFIGALSVLAAFPLSEEEMRKGMLKAIPGKAMDQNLKAFRYVSCTRSSASRGLRVMRSAILYRLSRRGINNSSNSFFFI